MISPAEDATGQININMASAAELEELPRIGPTKGQAIVEHRETNGSFQTVDDLQRVPGIGPATLEALRPLVTVGSGAGDRRFRERLRDR